MYTKPDEVKRTLSDAVVSGEMVLKKVVL